MRTLIYVTAVIALAIVGSRTGLADSQGAQSGATLAVLWILGAATVKRLRDRRR